MENQVKKWDVEILKLLLQWEKKWFIAIYRKKYRGLFIIDWFFSKKKRWLRYYGLNRIDIIMEWIFTNLQSVRHIIFSPVSNCH